MKRDKKLVNLAQYNCDAKTKFDYIKMYLDANCPSTYYKDGTLQCYKYKNRSVRDLYYLTRAKFKTTTLKEVCKIIFKLANGDWKNYGFIYCGDIKDLIIYTKRMHDYANFLQQNELRSKGFFNFKHRETTSGITYAQFLKLADYE